MGALPPYRVFDGNWSMGSSLGVACGAAMQGHPRVLAVIGDSTFFHAGIPPLIEAIQQNLKLSVILLDNGVAAMTGGQRSCHRPPEALSSRVDLVRLIESLGVTRCTPFEPHTTGVQGIQGMIEASFDEPGVKVLLYRSQCGLYSPGYFTPDAYSLKKKEVVHEVTA
jgi:indolepyruvate ferredoxin oxidoreductase, alpha subunit